MKANFVNWDRTFSCVLSQWRICWYQAHNIKRKKRKFKVLEKVFLVR